MTNKPGRPLFGLVLAGGESRRMGRDKALLERDGRSQLEHLVVLLGTVVDDVFVSARKSQQAEAERKRFPQIIDRYDNIGPVAGILSALEDYPGTDWLVVACDLPNIDTNTLEYLRDRADRDHSFAAYRSTYDGLPEPLCAIYRSGSDEIIHEFVDAGVVCPRKILIRSEVLLLEQPNPRALDNVNTPDDLEVSVLEVAS